MGRKCKLIILIFVVIFLTIHPSVSLAAKYMPRERFGVGWYGKGLSPSIYPLYDPVDLGIGWYANWDYRNIDKGVAADLAQKGFDRMALVRLEQASDLYSAANCDALKSALLANPATFSPGRVFWSIGNELGYLKTGLAASEYADEFIRWRDCIKSVDSRYKVGSGATVGLWVRLPLFGSASCVASKNDPESAYTYLKTYINRIKQIDSGKLPDFMAVHAYFGCTPPLAGDSSAFSKFKNTIITHRQAMLDLGLRGKDMWIKEYDPEGVSYYVGREEEFLRSSIDYLMTAKDQNIGPSGDDYHLVQRFAWFAYTRDPNITYHYYPLAVLDDGSLYPLGKAYRSMSRKYSKLGDANGDGAVDTVDFKIWAGNYGKTAATIDLSRGNFNLDTKVNVMDFGVWAGSL